MSQPAIDVPAMNPLYLVPVAGPHIEPLQLIARSDHPQGSTLGRHENCDLKLPATAETVSRFHARFRFDESTVQWRVSDLGSSWGTSLNGVKLTAQAELPLAEGDLLRVQPWTFSVSKTQRPRGMMTSDDTGQSIVRTSVGASGAAQPMRQDLLALLLKAAENIQNAATEAELSEHLLDTAVRGTGLPNAAVLRMVDSSGQIEILAKRTPTGADAPEQFTFSRSLLNAAAEGHAVELSPGGNQSESIVQMSIGAALCVPLMLGATPAAYLYLDSRKMPGRATLPSLRPNAASFCEALGTLAGLALANLKRLEIERRQAVMERDLTAAAAAQRWVLPPRETTIATFLITGESRPGRYVGGDFFDVMDLSDGKIAIALGDVSGKGVDASVLMTATQGFLHATLQHHRDPALAAAAVNAFVSPRRPTNRFVTLWMAVLDPAAGKLSYVDAGHGYAALIGNDGIAIDLNEGHGPPLGVVDEYPYSAETVSLPASGRLVIVSDGFVEQPAPTPDADGLRAMFNMQGVRETLQSKNADDIAELFERLIAHAGTTQLADDATAVCVRW